MHVNVMKDFKKCVGLLFIWHKAHSITLHLFQDVRNMSNFLFPCTEIICVQFEASLKQNQPSMMQWVSSNLSWFASLGLNNKTLVIYSGPFHRKWNFLLKTEFRSGYIQCIFLSYAIIKLSITIKILVWYHWFSYVCIKLKYMNILCTNYQCSLVFFKHRWYT